MNRRFPKIHERFLRHIWSNQYLKTRLEVLDGRSLTILDVGKLNSDGGPDFHNAKIKIDGVTLAGDIEIHGTIFDWLQHKHQKDPRYNKVILHVVLEAVNDSPSTFVHSGRQIPILVLSKFLSESIHTIWQKAILDERAKKSETIPCFHKNAVLTAESINLCLTKLAVERLELKIRRFDERLKQLAHERRMTLHEWQRPYGAPPFEGMLNEIPPPLPELTQKDFSSKELWEQVLYEAVMEGLGYSKNREPFVRLARSITLKEITNHRLVDEDFNLEALLFGVAGLIPKINSVNEKESREYVKRLVRNWKILRPSYHSELLHAADWQFFPTRPTNFPTIRLASACAIIIKFLSEDLFRRIIQTLKSTNLSSTGKENELLQLFNVETSDFWKHHYNFIEAAPKKFKSLGKMRIQEILINAVLPVALLYARIFKDKAVREGVLDVYRHLPAFENNSVTRLMEKQLLRGKLDLKNISHQQALIQLYSYYCTEGRCAECYINSFLF